MVTFPIGDHFEPQMENEFSNRLLWGGGDYGGTNKIRFFQRCGLYLNVKACILLLFGAYLLK